MNTSLFVFAADAAPAPSGPAAFLVQMMPLVLIFVIMYFLFIRPQQKRVREHQELVNHLKVGDRVVTSGGIHGTIRGVKEQTFQVEIANAVVIEISRGAVGTVVGKEKEEPHK